MSNHTPLPAVDPALHFTPDDAIGQWTPQQGPSQPGFPLEMPRHQPNENPEWSPRNPQEVPVRNPAPIPDWSPSSAAKSATDDAGPNTKHDSPSRPGGKHDLGDNPDGRGGPLVVEDPAPESQPAKDGGDIEDPESQKPAVLVAGSVKTAGRFTPSGRLMRFTSDEVYY